MSTPLVKQCKKKLTESPAKTVEPVLAVIFVVEGIDRYRRVSSDTGRSRMHSSEHALDPDTDW